MSRIEQAGYPYVEGSYGIPFEKSDKRKDKLIAGSGNVVYSTLERNYLEVTSFDNQHWMNAVVDSKGKLNLSLYSSIPINGRDVRHPDFFAGRFVDFAIVNFKQNGVEIKSMVGDWLKNSINFIQYMDILEETGNRIAAAKGTWTGNLARRHGFNLPTEEYITIENPDRIVVEFLR